MPLLSLDLLMTHFRLGCRQAAVPNFSIIISAMTFSTRFAGLSSWSDVCTGCLSMQHTRASHTPSLRELHKGSACRRQLASHLYHRVQLFPHMNETQPAAPHDLLEYRVPPSLIRALSIVCRYVAPLLVAATFTGALKRVMSLRQWSGWITPASGVCLLAGGTYGLLSRALPA